MEYGVMFILKEMDKTVNVNKFFYGQGLNAVVNCMDNQMRQDMYQKARWLLKSVQ
jgi:hypothetical protein